MGAAKATQTTAEYLSHHFLSPQLKALLATQWGDYGLPPKESAFAVHALVVDSYMNGAWFPKGGRRTDRARVRTRHRSERRDIKVSHEVTAILIEGGRAVGVKALDRRRRAGGSGLSRPHRHLRHWRARHLSTAAADDGEIGRRTAKPRACIDALEGGYSAVSLYIRLAQPASTLGVKGENYWINTTFEHDELEAETAATLAGAPRHAYLSFPSAKSGDDRFPNAEVIASVRPDAFAAWRGGSTGQRGPQYLELKARIAEGLLKLADSAVPGLKALTRYSELSTPFTSRHFTSHPAGLFYGLRGTPLRYRSSPLGARTPILASILRAAMLRASACPAPVGRPRRREPGSRARRPPAHYGQSPADEEGHRSAHADALAREDSRDACHQASLTPSIWRLEFELDEPIHFIPGQYVKLRVAPFEWRDYSIAAAAGNRVTLLISTRTARRRLALRWRG